MTEFQKVRAERDELLAKTITRNNELIQANDVLDQLKVELFKTNHAADLIAEEREHWKTEAMEQARLLGISGSREARLLARVERLEKVLRRIANYCEDEDPPYRVMPSSRMSEIAKEALKADPQ